MTKYCIDIQVPSSWAPQYPIQASIHLPHTLNRLKEIKDQEDEAKLALLIQILDGHSCSVICHGLLSSRQGHFHPRLVQEFGGIVIHFDMHGCGKTQGPFSLAGYKQDVKDLYDIVEFCQNTLHLQVETLIGHSRGANVVLLYSAWYLSRCPSLHTIVAIAGRFHLSELFPRYFSRDSLEKLIGGETIPWNTRHGVINISKEEYEQLNTLNMAAELQSLTRISEAPKIVIVHGSLDEIIPVADGEKFHQCLKGSLFIQLPGCTHCFDKTLPDGTSAEDQLFQALHNVMKENVH